MSERCRNCDSHVTDDYVRVFSRRGEDSVGFCPQCEMIWDGQQVREKHSAGGEPSDTPATDRDPSEDVVATDGGVWDGE